MLRGPGIALAALVAASASTVAVANDSSAELSTGGLVLTKNTSIALDREDLFISSREIRVHYRFRNGSGAPVTTLVAFPMPDITIENSDDNVQIPVTDAPDNFLGFSTTVDGMPVQARLEQKVFAKGVDQTDLMRRLGLPLAPYLEGWPQRLDGLAEAARKQLREAGLVHEETEYEGTRAVARLYPSWTLKTSYYWEQTFPPGDTEIDHRYRPSVGVTLGTPIGDDTLAAKVRRKSRDPSDRGEIADYEAHIRTYCVDADLVASAARIRKALPRSGTLIEQRISYILKTAANWAGPIRSFRLVVDKGYPDNLVSWCGHGIRKTGDTQFEINAENFVPASDLSIIILTTHLEN
ncbi:MAG: DUF4424 domain-containing protein [Xanthobacteraceae bacterium]|nr:DUF4424 domain-containing protein [Xanthobacteraceae bacterium]